MKVVSIQNIRMPLRAALLILASMSSFCLATSLGPSDRNYDKLTHYMKELAGISRVWQEAARMAYTGNLQQSYKIIEQPLDLPESNLWVKKTRDLGKYLRAIDKRWPNSYLSDASTAFLMVESPSLGVEYLQSLQEKEGQLEFQHSIDFSQCLVETGQFSRARSILQQLIKEDTANNWKDIINSRIASIEYVKDGTLSPKLYKTVFDIRVGWYRGRIGPIIQCWQSGKDLGHLQELRSKFKSVRDDHGHDLVLNVIAYAEIKGIGRDDSADAMLELANKAHKAEDHAEAFKLWRQVENRYKDTSAWGKAVFNVGILLKKQKKYDDAIKQFEKIVISDVDDTEPGSHIMEAYRNYRPKAYWEIANCYFAKGDYTKALEMYQACQNKHPIRSWCGTCRGQSEGRNAIYQGLCYEHLKKYDKAIASYFETVMRPFSSNPTAAIRIVDLYQSQNQLATLETILDQVDRYQVEKYIREEGKDIRKDKDFTEHVFTQRIRRILDIRDMGKQKNISALVEMVSKENQPVYPDKYRDRVTHAFAIEAAKALSRHPAAAVPLLKAELKGTNNDKLLYYALALCGRKDARDILIDAQKTADNTWQKAALEYALGILEKGPGPSEADNGVYFPDLPKKANLPTDLAELDDEVAYWHSLPKTVDIDLSTPESTIKTYITSMMLADKNAHAKCFESDDVAKKLYEDNLQTEKTNYEIAHVTFSDDGAAAEVDISLTVVRRSHRLIFALRDKNGRWLITGADESR